MMENWTLGAISVGLAFIVLLITNLKKLKGEIDEALQKALKPTNDKIDTMSKELKTQIEKTDLNSTKNFLVARISDIKSGNDLDDITKERFFEQYEHYLSMGGNSYIKNEVDKLKTSGKL